MLAIATAAVGALAGASTLGTPIVAGLQNQNTVPMLQGAAATAALAFLGDAALLAAVAGVARYSSLNTTCAPRLTRLARSRASQLVRRMQPCDSVLPTFSGSGVPWMP